MILNYTPESLDAFYNAIDLKFKNREEVTTIFDVGSLHCLESVEFSKKFSNAKIYAFEANKESYEVCMQNTSQIANIQVINKCINDYNGTCTFYPIDASKTVTTWFDGNRGASSMFKSNGAVDHIEKYVQNEVEVECIRLDTFCKSLGIERVDAIWMDLQGAELLALQGLGDILDTVQVIQTELEVNPMYENQFLFKDVDLFLEEKGFIRIAGNIGSTYGDNFVYIKK